MHAKCVAYRYIHKQKTKKCAKDTITRSRESPSFSYVKTRKCKVLQVVARSEHVKKSNVLDHLRWDYIEDARDDVRRIKYESAHYVY